MFIFFIKEIKYTSYLLLVETNDKTIQEFLKPHTPISDKNNDKTIIDEKKSQGKYLKESVTPVQGRYSTNDSEIPISQTSTLNDKLFEGNTTYISS